MASRQHDLKLYLEYQRPEERQQVRWSHVRVRSTGLMTTAQWVAAYPSEPQIMVFVKRFDVEAQSLTGIGHFYVHRHLRVADLVTMINSHQGYPTGTALRVYEEIKPGMIELMKQKATFLQSEIQDGDIVCYQTELSEQCVGLMRAPCCSAELTAEQDRPGRQAVSVHDAAALLRVAAESDLGPLSFADRRGRGPRL